MRSRSAAEASARAASVEAGCVGIAAAYGDLARRSQAGLPPCDLAPPPYCRDMARHFQVAIDCDDPDRLVVFWAEVLGYRSSKPPPGHNSWAEYSRAVATEPGEAWNMAVDPDRVQPSLFFHRVPERKTIKNRVHLDIRLAPGAPDETARPLVDAEARRLVGLGATHLRTDDGHNDYYAVMQDPEGNEFCVG